jgi:hypothetical protein
MRTLKYFAVDKSRHAKVVDVEFYQMDLASLVETALGTNPGQFDDGTDALPSWSKFAANPVRAKGFFTYMLQAVFEGKHNADELNIDYQTGRKAAKEGPKVAMMFLPGSTRNELLLEAANFASEALPGFVVVPISGAAGVTNASAEQTAKEEIEKATKLGKSVLLLSAGMAQRSFSIPQITELYLAYDNGDNGATIQKMSRTLTPDEAGKVGRVISLSFDPNRDDKFDALIIETAQNYQKNKKIPDLKTALAAVIKTIDIYSCQPDGAVKIDPDTYLADALSRGSIDRVIGKVANLAALTPEEIRALASGKADVFRAAKQAAAAKGKTRVNGVKVKKGASKTDASDKELATAREVLVTISQNLDLISCYGDNLDEAFEFIDNADVVVREGIALDFGVEYEFIKELVFGGTFNRNLVDLKFV